MKKNISYKRSAILLALLALAFTACNKDALDGEYAMHVTINGYNGSGNALQVSIDTTQYDQTISYGAYIIKPVSLLQFNAVYTYIPNGQQRMVVLTDTATKKVVFSKPLPATGTKTNFNFLLIDGKEVAIQAPAADTSTNKLGFYIRNTENDEPFDLFLYKMDNSTGQEYRTYLAKDVKPNTWIYVNYVADEPFGSENILKESNIYFTKAGTTDQWAFRDEETRSKVSVFGMGFPLTGEKGLVQSYFCTQGNWQLEQVKLFFPDRPW